MVAATNLYWEGKKHGQLDRHSIPTAWLSDGHLSDRLAVCNKAFCIFYHARLSLEEQKSSEHWVPMCTALERCAREGWGVGVNDMEEACQHLARNNGKWSDTSTSSYHGGPGRSYNRMIVDVPTSIANFLEAIDDKLPKMKEAMEAYKKHCYAMSHLRISRDSPSEWEKVKEHVDKIKSYADKAKELLWLGPATIQVFLPRTAHGMDTMRQVQAFSKGIQPTVAKSISTLDWFGKVHDAMTIYTDARRAFSGHENEHALGIAFAALNLAISYVPGIGSAYGEIIKRIPGLVEDWREFINDYKLRHDSPVAFLRTRVQQSRKPRCTICGNSL